MIFRIFILFSILLNFAKISAQSYNTQVYKGNNQFDRKNYSTASSEYRLALQQNGNDFVAHYKLGNALYKEKRFKEAETEYQKAELLAKNQADKAAAVYNRGNISMQANDSEKAAELYKKSLKIDPYNEAVRKNYEIAMLKNQQQQQNQQQKDKNEQNQNGKNQDQNSENNAENQQQKSGGNQQNQQGQGNNANQNKPENNSENMSKNLQNAILNRTENRERETAKRILNKNAYSMPESNEKDW
jgi:tetratricopeptide (TPR) repeat protein